MEEEANSQIIRAWEWARRSVGVQLKDHQTRVVRNAVETVPIYRGQVGEAEERLERTIGAKLDGQFCLSGTRNGAVQALYNLRGEGCAGNGTNGLGGIVR